MTQPEPNVLDYASPQTNRRRRRVIDRLVFLLALLQICAWAVVAKSAYSRPVFGRQESLFAWCWWYTENPTTGPGLMAALSLLVLATSARPAENRAGGYRVYLLSMAISVPLDWFARWYVLEQLPGVWGSMLNTYEHRTDSTDLISIILLGNSVLIMFLGRLMTGRKLRGI